nr:zinc finger BED domain-containing protein RICESLEEPER 2-like [Tanacetum cinerariifolium]
MPALAATRIRGMLWRLDTGFGDLLSLLKNKNTFLLIVNGVDRRIGTVEIEGDEAYFKSGDFTVLGWWKRRSLAFPVLYLVARDILAILISPVASESIFSTGGIVLDSFRSSLSLETVQALICCQDWVRSVDVVVNLKENINDMIWEQPQMLTMEKMSEAANRCECLKMDISS